MLTADVEKKNRNQKKVAKNAFCVLSSDEGYGEWKTVVCGTYKVRENKAGLWHRELLLPVNMQHVMQLFLSPPPPPPPPTPAPALSFSPPPPPSVFLR